MNEIHNRFIKNIGSISEQEQRSLFDKTVLVLGCGGLGCNVIEELVRLGVGNIIAYDGDRYDESNINRQLYATSDTLGTFKVEAAKQRALSINPVIHFDSFNKRFDPKEDLKYIEQSDVVVDCLDNNESKQILCELCKKANKPLVYGSVVSYQGQVSTILPNSKTLPLLYDDKSHNSGSSLSFMVTLVSSIQVLEAFKLLLQKKANLVDKLLVIDGDTLEFQIINL